MIPAATALPETSHASCEGWSIHVAQEIGSTNSAASHLPAWHAVRASVQTDGRGRTGRTWVSDEGGLWLSAVLPCVGNRARWSILPLAVGWAIVAALHELGARGLRLRWPNDIMVGRRKLAGLLVERYKSDSAVVGVGINVENSPEQCQPALAGTTARLVDLVSGAQSIDDLTRLVLRSIGRAHAIISKDQFTTIADELNVLWSEPRLVSLTLTQHSHSITGLFTGVDYAGRVLIRTERFGIRAYDASQVALIRELQ